MKDHEIMHQFDKHLDLITQITLLADLIVQSNRVLEERLTIANMRIDSLARQLERMEGNK